jgi:Na+-transporting NADH:ubiquinone oxidoreductase subunit NqrD
MTKEEVIHLFPAAPLPSFILTIGVYGLGIGFMLLIIDVLRAGWGMHSIRGSIAGSSDSKYGEIYFWFAIVLVSASLTIVF